jgi:hypothetical protein
MVRKVREGGKMTAGRPKKKAGSKTAAPQKSSAGESPSDWRSEVLSRIRELILQADPHAVEERKWKKPSNPAGVPVWSHDGIICTGETYRNCIKLTFAKGAALQDPSRLFNASLDGNARRAIDIREGDKINEKAFRQLVRAAVQLNGAATELGR